MTFIDPYSFARVVDPGLHDLPGGVFYSSPAAFSTPSKLYLLGMNPGGSAENTEATIGKNLAAWREREQGWCEYVDEPWEGPPGKTGIQPQIRFLFDRLGIGVSNVPASNVVFVRSNVWATLNQKAEMLKRCWPVHEAVIRDLGVSTIICLGQIAGGWVRSLLGAHQKIGEFSETYQKRHSPSEAHVNPDGIAVLMLAHPCRSDWRKKEADPSAFVRKVLAR